jgi:hypothetical protein
MPKFVESGRSKDDVSNERDDGKWSDDEERESQENLAVREPPSER